MTSNNSLLSIHHVGGRSGTRSFPVLDQFEKDVINVLYDADKSCLDHIREQNSRNKSKLHVLPYCVSDSARSTDFNLGYDPNTSSLYEFNRRYDEYSFLRYDHDYIFGETFKPMKQVKVDVRSLDEIMSMPGVSIPHPDFLSLDTQGAEFDILRGAKNCLGDHVLAMTLETELHELYSGQKLFGDVSSLANEHGFDFVTFTFFDSPTSRMNDVYPHYSPIGFRSRGFTLYADALFVRRVESIEESGANDGLKWLHLSKLAFFSLIFDQVSYSLKCLHARKNYSKPRMIDSNGTTPAYISFLEDFERVFEAAPKYYPDSFTGLFTYQNSTERFSTKREGSGADPGRSSQDKESLMALHKVFCDWVRAGREGEDISIYYSPAEQVLLDYGLGRQAETLRDSRNAHIRVLAESFNKI